MPFQRMMDKEHEPTDNDIIEYIGEKSKLWVELHDYLEKNYDFLPETIFYGKKYGWTIRYRKSGKTLCSFFPEKDSFTVLITLGRKEVEETKNQMSILSSNVQSIFKEAKQLRDGRWLWIRVETHLDVSSIRTLLNTKRKPRNL